MKLFGEIAKIEPQDDGTLKVYGFASAPVRDAHGEIVTADAMKNAIGGYMKFPAVREMHDATKAAGRAIEISTQDDGKTAMVAHVVDPVAVKKVQAGVYPGFSIGGRVKKRNASDATVIDEIELVEISLVDRPSCPEAIINLWKREELPVELTGEDLERIAASADEIDGVSQVDDGEEITRRKFNAKQRREAANSGAALPDGSFPIENKSDLHNAIQAYGRAKDKAKAKAHIKARAKALGAEDMLPDDWKSSKAAETDDLVKSGDAPAPELSGAQKAAATADELMKGVMANLAKIETREAPAAAARTVPGAFGPAMELRKGMYTLGGFAQLLMEVAYLVFDTEAESQMEGDSSPVPAKLRTAFRALAEAYRSMSDEELTELQAQVDNGAVARSAAVALMDLQKIEGDVPALEPLRKAVQTLAAKGVEMATPEAGAETAQRLAKAEDSARAASEALAKLQGEHDGLLQKMGEMNAGLATLNERLEKLSQEPIPAKTAGSIHAVHQVSKADDASAGPARERITEEDVQKVLASMPADERALVLIKAAHANPMHVQPSGWRYRQSQ